MYIFIYAAGQWSGGGGCLAAPARFAPVLNTFICIYKPDIYIYIYIYIYMNYDKIYIIICRFNGCSTCSAPPPARLYTTRTYII